VPLTDWHIHTHIENSISEGGEEHMKHLKFFAIGLLSALAIAASACGGGATAPTAAPASNPTSAPAATAASSGNTSAQKTKVSIMVGGLNKIIYLVPTLTKQLGYFDEQGLDMQVLDEPSGVSAEDAMLSGQVNGTVGFYDHNIDLQGKGKKTEAVVIFDWVPGEAEVISSKLADQIKSPADFKGRNLGVTSIGSSTYFLTNYLAVKSGLKPEDIHPIAVGAGDTFIAALQKAQIDAGMTTEPTISRLLKTGDGKILIDMRTAAGTKAALGGTYPAASLYMQTDWVNSHKDAVQKLANAFVKTLKWIHTHTADDIVAKVPQDFYAGDKDLYLNAMKGSMDMFSPDGTMPPDGPQTILNVLSAFDKNVQGKQIDLNATYTNEFVNAAQSQ
jgi:NitT/TauT family transport system substrate-binding protein